MSEDTGGSLSLAMAHSAQHRCCDAMKGMRNRAGGRVNGTFLGCLVQEASSFVSMVHRREEIGAFGCVIIYLWPNGA